MLSQRNINWSILLLVIPIFALIAANLEVLLFLLSKWLDFDHGAYNHGILLLPISFYYLWKTGVFKHEVTVNWVGVVFCTGLIMLTFAANIIHVASVQVVSVYLFIWCLIFTFFGWRSLKASFWPLMLMSFALPLWDSVGIFLQKLTLEVSYFMVYASGIPVLKEGFQIIIPQGRFEVEPSCSGLSYFLAASSLAVIYAMMNYKSRGHYVIVIGSIIFASIIANWVRVYIVIMAGYFTDMKHSLVQDHFNLGWVLFGLFFIVLLYFFNKKLHVEDLLQHNNAEQIKSANQSIKINPYDYVVKLSVILVFIGTLFGYQSFVSNKAATYNPDKSALRHVDPLQTIEQFSVSLGQHYAGAKERYYQANFNGEQVQIYEAFYESQSQGKELVQGSNVLYNEEYWKEVSNKKLTVADGEIGELKLLSFSSASTQPVTVFYWYFVDGKRTVSGAKTKVAELLSFIKGEKSAMAYIVLVKNENIAKRWIEFGFREAG